MFVLGRNGYSVRYSNPECDLKFNNIELSSCMCCSPVTRSVQSKMMVHVIGLCSCTRSPTRLLLLDCCYSIAVTRSLLLDRCYSVAATRLALLDCPYTIAPTRNPLINCLPPYTFYMHQEISSYLIICSILFISFFRISCSTYFYLFRIIDFTWFVCFLIYL